MRSSESAKTQEPAADWLSELDSHMATLDSSLAPPPRAAALPARRDDVREPRLRPGKVLMIRYRMPRLPWPFRLLQRRRQRREHPLTTARIRA